MQFEQEFACSSNDVWQHFSFFCRGKRKVEVGVHNLNAVMGEMGVRFTNKRLWEALKYTLIDN